MLTKTHRPAPWAYLLLAISAMVTLTPTASSASAAPCGLSYSGPVFGRYDYTIRNCHDYAVRRKLDIRRPIVGHPDGPCHYIPAGRTIGDWTSIPDSAYIAGIKAC
ncbi:hypothetical protein [Streptosporangium sp. NPDC006930]|uniref:hypothetical protein n=1 Tax=unclassified Streptosporangium TaxID=2632669 RepID=UPI003414C11E